MMSSMTCATLAWLLGACALQWNGWSVQPSADATDLCLMRADQPVLCAKPLLHHVQTNGPYRLHLLLQAPTVR